MSPIRRSPARKKFNQTLLKIFSSNPARKFLIAIMIAIEKQIRINQTLIEKFLSDHNRKKVNRSPRRKPPQHPPLRYLRKRVDTNSGTSGKNIVVPGSVSRAGERLRRGTPRSAEIPRRRMRALRRSPTPKTGVSFDPAHYTTIYPEIRHPIAPNKTFFILRREKNQSEPV